MNHSVKYYLNPVCNRYTEKNISIVLCKTVLYIYKHCNEWDSISLNGLRLTKMVGISGAVCSYTCNKLPEISMLFLLFSPTRLLQSQRHKMQHIAEKNWKQTPHRCCKPNQESREGTRQPMDHVAMVEQTKNGIYMQ